MNFRHFEEKDFTVFANVVNPKKFYHFAEQELEKVTVEVNGGVFMIFFKVEIKLKGTNQVIGRGAYHDLNKLNTEVETLIKKYNL